MDPAQRLNIWRKIYRTAAESEKPYVSTIGRLYKRLDEGSPIDDIAAADVDALKAFTNVEFDKLTIGAVDLMASRFITRIVPRNCYDAYGTFTAAKGKNYNYLDIRRLTAAPVEIKETDDVHFYHRCHAAAYHVLSSHLINALKIRKFADVLLFGFDLATNEFILPLTEKYYAPIKLNYGGFNSGFGFDNYQQALRVISHLNLNANDISAPYTDNRFFSRIKNLIVVARIFGNYNVNLPY